MEILVIDRESLTNQLITSKLGAKGHQVTVEPNKNAAFELLGSKPFDCVMVDPAPLSEARPVIIGVWKSLKSAAKPYLMLLSKAATTEDAILAGANDVLIKPLSSQELDEKTGNAARLMTVARMLAREDNVHSTGGMIGKAAFNQLFLSATDRAFRYGERSLIVFVRLMNHEKLQASVTPEVFDGLMEKLAKQMTYMRRQSDVIGRLGADDFAILLQRPQYESEPIDAINRFSEQLDKFCATYDAGSVKPEIHLRLVELPQGAQHAERFVPQAVQAAGNGE
ncbi:MAG TPA: diguanylate cyclase [Alphaproteobacteria bacterium]|nr:DNA-binding response regulator [Rhodospirillaceae bacterium]HRJ66559.1 diguanylate cyclase [Alphaproteobacteria bacterium]